MRQCDEINEIVRLREMHLRSKYGYSSRRSDMYTDLISKAQCTAEEKKEILKTIAVFIALTERARRYGLLALEQAAEKLPCDFMRIGVNMILSGYDPQLIERMLMNIIYFENPCGKELLERLISVEGILAVWGDDNPIAVKTKLLSYLGEKYSAEVYKDGSEVNSLLEKYSSFNNFKQDKASHSDFDANQLALNLVFSAVIRSSIVLKTLSKIYVLGKEKPEVLKDNFGSLSNIIYDFINDVLMPEIREAKSLNMRFDQVELLAKKLQTLHDDCFCWNDSLESVLRQPELMDIKGKERYKIYGFRKVVREFFKVILAVISEKEWCDKFQPDLFSEIIRHCVVEGKPAIEFVEGESLKLLLGGLEKSVLPAVNV